MKTALIIINYNDSKTTLELLANVADYTCLDKVLIVDNHSTDESAKILKKHCKNNIELLVTSSNKGYGAGINEGVKHLPSSNQEWNIIIANPDIKIQKESDLKELLSYLKKKDIAVVAPRISEQGIKNIGWKLSTPWQEIGYSLPFIYQRIQKKYKFYSKDDYQGKTTTVEVVSGCMFLTRTDILRDVGYFDETLFLYYEEDCLAQKIKEVGKEIVLVNDVQIIHDHSVSIDKSLASYQKFKTLKKSQEYYVKAYQKANVIQRATLFLCNRINFFIRYLKSKIN